MFEDLARAIEGIEPAADERELVELIGLRDRLEARISQRVAEADRAGLWEADGSTSMVAFLKRHSRMAPAEASACVRTSRIVQRCPAVAEAWREGRLSSGQVAVIRENVKPKLLDLFAEHAPGVVDQLVPLDLAGTVQAMQRWVILATIRLGLDDALPPEPPRDLYLSPTLDGHGKLNANLDAEGYEVVKTAFGLAETRDAKGDDRPASQRRADALVDICRYYLDHQKVRLGGRRRPHVNVVVPIDGLADGRGGRTMDGRPLDGSTIKRLLCDAGVHRVLTDGRSSILDYGHTTRTIPPAVYTALVLRDRHCRFPGCDRPPEWTEGHHIWAWEDGGPTELGNLVLLCSRHHHLIHHRDWHLKLLPTAVVEVTRPDGQVMTSDPPLLT